MEMTIDDNVKRQLLDKLAEEPPMVISTAYAYAKNYVMYGEDITKAWTTAVQQASILEKARQQAWAEAYDSFKQEYENRLKADLKAILVELQLEIHELENPYPDDFDDLLPLAQHNAFYDAKSTIEDLVDERINAIKGDQEGEE